MDLEYAVAGGPRFNDVIQFQIYSFVESPAAFCNCTAKYDISQLASRG